MSQTTEPIISELANDPDMLDLVEEFVSELPKRAEAVSDALAQEDFELVRRLAHQLKGAAGGYGFSPISATAAALEQCVQEQCEMDDIVRQVQSLADECNRARAQ